MKYLSKVDKNISKVDIFTVIKMIDNYSFFDQDTYIRNRFFCYNIY